MTFEERKQQVEARHEAYLALKNTPIEDNGIFCRWQNPIITAETTPLIWRYDYNPETNPFFMERLGVNAALNSGAIKLGDKYVLVVRVEGDDRKPEAPEGSCVAGLDAPATNVYDMRLTRHEDGWIYGLFCVERHDDSKPNDLSAATATCGIARTKDLIHWDRLPDLKSRSQQRNVVLHPEFVNGKYALYTRPQDGFIDAGSGGGIGWALVDDMTNAVVTEERIINSRHYHTIMEVKNGEGPHPIKTPEGWLHLAHGVRGCASGLRYVLYMYMTALDDPTRVIAQPGGAFMVPEGGEYIGDVMNVLFTNGWICDGDNTNGASMHQMEDKVFIYYASSDTRMHVATSTIAQLVDYCKHTPADGLRTGLSVVTRNKLIDSNLAYLQKK